MKTLKHLAEKGRLALIALGLWAIRNLAEKRLIDVLPQVFEALDSLLISELKHDDADVNVDAAIRSVIRQFTKENARQDQVAIVRALFDPKHLLNRIGHE